MIGTNMLSQLSANVLAMCSIGSTSCHSGLSYDFKFDGLGFATLLRHYCRLIAVVALLSIPSSAFAQTPTTAPPPG
jgi:hypothetical protein